MSLYGSLLSPERQLHSRTPVSFNSFRFNRFRTLFALASLRISRNSSGINRLRTLAKEIGEWVGSDAFLPLDVRTLRRYDACPPWWAPTLARRVLAEASGGFKPSQRSLEVTHRNQKKKSRPAAIRKARFL